MHSHKDTVLIDTIVLRYVRCACDAGGRGFGRLRGVRDDCFHFVRCVDSPHEANSKHCVCCGVRYQRTKASDCELCGVSGEAELCLAFHVSNGTFDLTPAGCRVVRSVVGETDSVL
jgi:hypothetical protein